jgi:hypothetical protein
MIVELPNELDGEYSLAMPFVDQSPSFAHGFECGQLWEQMKRGETIEGELINAQNREQVEKMCRRFRYEYIIGDSADGWYSFSAKPTGGQN